MTTLAIIGGGIAGKSLLYQLAKEKKIFKKIILFDSSIFAKSCSLNSTAIVAPRGLTVGHSDLGDLLLEGFHCFSKHVKDDSPEGVTPVIQYTGTYSKEEAFKLRYPESKNENKLDSFHLHFPCVMAREEAFMIEPETYLPWLFQKAKALLPLEVHQDFIIQIEKSEEKVFLKTQNGLDFTVDHLIMAGGSHHRFWKNLSSDPKLKSSKSVQGSYLKFDEVEFPTSFSLTLEGDNLIYHKNLKRLLMGSTTQELGHEMVSMKNLRSIYERLQEKVSLEFPEFTQGIVHVGLREKASKRAPYLIHENRLSLIGGLYKNGYSLSLKLAKKLIIHLQLEHTASKL